MNNSSKINNAFYDNYGTRWYTAYDDPVALLRAENKIKLDWLHERIVAHKLHDPIILDVGCGAGFLCNELSLKGYQVHGIDLSEESLNVARQYDQTGLVQYQTADAYQLPFPDHSMDIITCFDFLEHVERPEDVIKECARVLKPNGLFFFHTFSRNFFSWLLVIKAIELLVKNTPKDMHVIELFINPEELEQYCQNANINVVEMTGLRPKFSTIPISAYFSGVVPESLEFKMTPSLLLSYLGMGIKIPG